MANNPTHNKTNPTPSKPSSNFPSPSNTNNKTSKNLPDEKAKLLIRNTWSSVKSSEDDTKSNDDPDHVRSRVHSAGDQLILQNRDREHLKTVCGNFNKKTYCYKMITEEGVKYFVKIFEDSQMSPTKVAKQLYAKSERNPEQKEK